MRRSTLFLALFLVSFFCRSTDSDVLSNRNNECNSILTCTTPSQPSVIAGNYTVCNGTTQTYSVVNDPLATSYIWTLPGGWTGTSNTNVITSIAAGSGVISVAASNSCGASPAQTVNVLVGGFTNVVTTATNTTCYGFANGIASVSYTGGIGTVSVLWQPSLNTNTTAMGLAPGVQTVTLTDANSCSITKTVTILQPTQISTSFTTFGVSCNGGTSGTSTIQASGGTPFGGPVYNYFWMPSMTTGSILSGASAGIYTCSVTDANSCTKSFTVNIIQPPALSITVNNANPKCFNTANGTATANVSGGTPIYQYSWTPTPGTGSNTSTPGAMAAGNYSVLITDNHGCMISSSLSLANPPQMLASVTKTDATCFNGCNGIAIASTTNAVGPLSYTWFPSPYSTPTVSSFCAGGYTLIVEDQNNCTATAGVFISQPTQINGSFIAFNGVSCNGGSNGSATIMGSGGTPFAGPPYNYFWTPSLQTGSVLTNASAGTHTCTITDANSCSNAFTINIFQPPPLVINTNTVVNVNCFGGTTGQIATNVSGGTASYTYSWSPSLPPTPTVTGVSAATYTLHVIDASGCTTNSVYTISQPTQLVVISTNTSIACGANGTATVNIAGGIPGYLYSWSPITQTTNIATSLTNGVYTLTTTDNNGCTLNTIVSVPGGVSPTVSATSSNSLICVGQTAIITATGANTYTWNTTASGSVIAISPTLTSTYTLSGTTSYGCSGNFTITQLVSPCTVIENNFNEISVLKIYPNPFSSEITLAITNFKEELNVIIYNSLGQLVYKTKLMQAKSSINLTELPPGIYLVESGNQQEKKLLKLIKD